MKENEEKIEVECLMSMKNFVCFGPFICNDDNNDMLAGFKCDDLLDTYGPFKLCWLLFMKYTEHFQLYKFVCTMIDFKL